MFSKLEFQAQCKFSIAFENDISPGYTTEKILHAFISNTIPIHWGNPEFAKDFNPKAFINCHDYENFEDVIDRVREVEDNAKLYLSIINEPPFVDNQIPEELKRNNMIAFLKNIFDQEKEKVYRRSFYGISLKYENTLKNLIKSRCQQLQRYLKFFKIFKK